MSKKELQETEHIRIEADPVDNSDAEAPQAANVARRRALIAGLAAAPAVLTLIARPVWAQTARVASPGICASLAAASSLHTGDQQLAADCDATLRPPTTPP